MEIDNDKRASRAKMLLISLPFVLLVAGSVPALFLWIDTWIPTLVAGSLVILGWAATVILKLTSVKFKFTDEAISVLYYPISPMTSNYKRIDIDSDKLLNYQIRISWGGLKKDLILYEKIGGEEASYPPVSITLCKKNLILEIEENLSGYCSKGTNS